MNGIFCLEGFWYGDHRDPTSVYPILDLVERYENIPFIHHKCSTIEEFKYSITRWKRKGFHNKYPLLYLAFHGEKGLLIVGKTKITLTELAELLEDKCSGVVIYFAACATLKVDKRLLQSFMKKTKTIALLGFSQNVDWLTSAAFDIQLFSYLLRYPFNSKGIKKVEHEIMTDHRYQVRRLDFRFIRNENKGSIVLRKKT